MKETEIQFFFLYNIKQRIFVISCRFYERKKNNERNKKKIFQTD